jgi:predicted transcriptional regulator
MTLIFQLDDPVSKLLIDLYEGIDEDYPLGKERIVIVEDTEFDLKETFEKMAMSPERKILVVPNNGIPMGIITMSDLFKIINIDK